MCLTRASIQPDATYGVSRISFFSIIIHVQFIGEPAHKALNTCPDTLVYWPQRTCSNNTRHQHPLNFHILRSTYTFLADHAVFEEKHVGCDAVGTVVQHAYHAFCVHARPCEKLHRDKQWVGTKKDWLGPTGAKQPSAIKVVAGWCT